jgi:hypothetical protein
MKLPKEMEGRYANLLMEGISVQEVKIQKITPEEVICTYGDNEEVHIATEFLRAWWPDPKRDRSHKKAVKAGRVSKLQRDPDGLRTEDLPQEGTNTTGEG